MMQGTRHHHKEEMRDTSLIIKEEGCRSPLASPLTRMGLGKEATHDDRPPWLLQHAGSGSPCAATMVYIGPDWAQPPLVTSGRSSLHIATTRRPCAAANLLAFLDHRCSPGCCHSRRGVTDERDMASAVGAVSFARPLL
jgi:hypothetical protein